MYKSNRINIVHINDFTSYTFYIFKCSKPVAKKRNISLLLLKHILRLSLDPGVIWYA